jgi:hypothetical protein
MSAPGSRVHDWFASPGKSPSRNVALKQNATGLLGVGVSLAAPSPK